MKIIKKIIVEPKMVILSVEQIINLYGLPW